MVVKLIEATQYRNEIIIQNCHYTLNVI